MYCCAGGVFIESCASATTCPLTIDSTALSVKDNKLFVGGAGADLFISNSSSLHKEKQQSSSSSRNSTSSSNATASADAEGISPAAAAAPGAATAGEKGAVNSRGLLGRFNVDATVPKVHAAGDATGTESAEVSAPVVAAAAVSGGLSICTWPAQLNVSILPTAAGAGAAAGAAEGGALGAPVPAAAAAPPRSDGGGAVVDSSGGVLMSEVWAGAEGQLPAVAVRVLNEFGALVSGRQAGLMAVEAVAKCNVNNSSSSGNSVTSDRCQLQGLVRVTPVAGVSQFPELTLQGRPGTSHELRFHASAEEDQNVSPGDTSLVSPLVSKQRLLVHLLPCGPGQATTSLGCTSCQAPTFSYSREGVVADSCSSCPEGVTEVCNMSVLVPTDGYWHSGPRSAYIIPCPRPSACLRDQAAYQKMIVMQEQLANGDFTNSSAVGPRGLRGTSLALVTPSDQAYSDLLCAEGYHGHLCAQCSWDGTKDGVLYGLNLVGCRQCPGKAVAVLVYLACRLFDLLLVLLLVTVTLTERKRRKSATRTWQTTAILAMQAQQMKQQEEKELQDQQQQQERRLAGLEERPMEQQEAQQQQQQQQEQLERTRRQQQEQQELSFAHGSSSQTAGQTIPAAPQLQPSSDAAAAAVERYSHDHNQHQQQEEHVGLPAQDGSQALPSLPSAERRPLLGGISAFFLSQQAVSQEIPPSNSSLEQDLSIHQHQQDQQGDLELGEQQQQQQPEQQQGEQHGEQQQEEQQQHGGAAHAPYLPSFLQSATPPAGSSSSSYIPTATAPATAPTSSSRATSMRYTSAPTTTVSFLSPSTSTAFPTPLTSSATAVAAGTSGQTSSATAVAAPVGLVSRSGQERDLSESEDMASNSTWSYFLRWFNKQHRWQAPAPSTRSLTSSRSLNRQSKPADQQSNIDLTSSSRTAGPNFVPGQHASVDQVNSAMRRRAVATPATAVAGGPAVVAAAAAEAPVGRAKAAVAGAGGFVYPGATAQLRWSTELQRLLLRSAPRAQLLQLLPALLGVIVMGPLLEVSCCRCS